MEKMDIVSILKLGVKHRASDILISVGCPPIFRINGKLCEVGDKKFTSNDAKKLIYSLLREDQIVKLESRKELDFSFTVEEKFRFRGNAFFQRGCVSCALRLIPDKIPTLSELRLPRVLEEFAMAKQGLVLVTGPTGQGKSTTQAAMINFINQNRRVHVITIEDPIEFMFSNNKSMIEQREVGDDTLSFAEALKHVLRQSPDVILVGEMRDLESIQAALTAAETGHLIISTLHTNDCVQAVDRLIDVFPPHQQQQIRAQLSMCLIGVISQRLVPRKDGSGLVVAVEVMRNTPAVANLIRDHKTHQIYTIMQTQAREGMITMDQALKELYLADEISYEECRSRMVYPQSLEQL